MKNLKIIIGLVMLYLLLAKVVQAQGKTEELKVGDQVPEIVFNNVLNSKQKSFKLSAFKGKLVILDFFATWCVPCIKALPKMDSLQKQFPDQLVILPITTEKISTVNAMLNNISEVKQLNLPYIFETNLKNFFPYRIVPHEVWIDGSGKVVAITDHEQVTSVNIENAIKKIQNVIKTKKDVLDQKTSKSFLSGRFGSYQIKSDQILYSSTIIQGFDGVASSALTAPIVQRGDDGKELDRLAIRLINCHLQKLYQISLLDDFNLPPKDGEISVFYTKKEFYFKMLARIIWEAKDSTYYFGTETKERMRITPYKEQAFNYELILPTRDVKLFKSYMLNDLNRYFALKLGIEGLREKRKVKCYALTIIGDSKLFRTKGQKKELLLDAKVRQFKVNNTRIDEFMFWWLSFHIPYFKIPVINETGYDEPIDLDLGEIDTKDFNAVNTALRKFGLEFKLVEREIDMLVIRDKKQ